MRNRIGSPLSDVKTETTLSNRPGRFIGSNVTAISERSPGSTGRFE
jgi:hypothetical protein